jgi:hypothetical protein
MHNTLLKRFLNSRSRNRKSKACPELRRRIQNRKWVGIFAIVVALTVCGARAEAQQPTKIRRIGLLDGSTAAGSAVLVDAFRQELSKLGWIEGKNITIEDRFAEQKSERIPDLAADLVRLKVDLIVVHIDAGGIGGQESDYYNPYRDGERFGPRCCRSS